MNWEKWTVIAFMTWSGLVNIHNANKPGGLSGVLTVLLVMVTGALITLVVFA